MVFARVKAGEFIPNWHSEPDFVSACPAFYRVPLSLDNPFYVSLRVFDPLHPTPSIDIF
jgi:hypothetical protein